MRWNRYLVVLPALLIPWNPAWAQRLNPSSSQGSLPQLEVGVLSGFQSGPSLQLLFQARDFAQGLPFEARVRMGWTGVEPGNPGDARRIFINDATNGTPREAGETLDLGFDALIPFGPRTRMVGGVRYSRFKANFKYIGGNEDFDVTSSHWGLAGGLEASYPMGSKAALLISGGGEYFFQSRLTGHDTSYSPDGDDVNPRKDYTFSQADEAVGQPTWRPFILLGVTLGIGG